MDVPANQSGRSATIIETFGAAWPGAGPAWVFTVRAGCGDRGRVLNTFALGSGDGHRASGASMARAWCLRQGYDEIWELVPRPLAAASGGA